MIGNRLVLLIAPSYIFDNMKVWVPYENILMMCRIVCAAGVHGRCVSVLKDVEYDHWVDINDMRVRQCPKTGSPIYETIEPPKIISTEGLGGIQRVSMQIMSPAIRIAGQIQSLIQKLERREFKQRIALRRSEEAKRIRSIPLARIPE